jgi:hypothetical protein
MSRNLHYFKEVNCIIEVNNIIYTRNLHYFKEVNCLIYICKLHYLLR